MTTVLCLRQDAALGGPGVKKSLRPTSCLVSELAAPPVQPHPKADHPVTWSNAMHSMDGLKTAILFGGTQEGWEVEMTNNVYSLSLWECRHGAHRLCRQTGCLSRPPLEKPHSSAWLDWLLPQDSQGIHQEHRNCIIQSHPPTHPQCPPKPETLAIPPREFI